MIYNKGILKMLNADRNNKDICEQGYSNYNSIDVAKFICSILVVMIHIAPFGKQESNSFFWYVNFMLQNGICRVAVPLFFVFSGFFLYKKTPLEEFDILSTRKYIMRILRIYLIWSLIYLPLSIIKINDNSTDILYVVGEYIRRFTLLGSYTQLWYLNALVVAVVMVSFLLYKKWKPQKILYVALVFYAFGLLGDGYFRITAYLTGIPFIKDIIRVYFAIFVTTRNGIFFGFFFVSLGMILSNVKYNFSTKRACLFFILSLFMMCIECFAVKTFSMGKDYNVLVFAVPATLFGFLFLKSLKLKNRNIYGKLRLTSSLIFYGHLWINYIVSKYIPLSNSLKGTPARFLIVLTITVVISLIIIKLSNQRGFRWLKKIY